MFHKSSHKADSRKRNHCGSRLFIVPGSFFWPINSLLIIVNSSLYFIIHHIPGTCQRFTFVLLYSMENRSELGRSRIYNSGESRGETRGAPPLIFRPNWGPKGRKKLFLRPPPLSQGLDGSLTFGVGVRSFRVYMIYAQFSPVPDFIPFFNGRGLVFNWLQTQGFRMTKSKSP